MPAYPLIIIYVINYFHLTTWSIEVRMELCFFHYRLLIFIVRQTSIEHKQHTLSCKGNYTSLAPQLHKNISSPFSGTEQF